MPRAEVEATLRTRLHADTRHEPTAPKPRTKPTARIVSGLPQEPQSVEPVRHEAVPVPVEHRKQPEEHSVIQERIRIEAEQLGFEVKLEQLILDGRGRADLLLAKGTRSIVCEITVTTTVEQEAAKIARYVKGPFQHIAIIASDSLKLERIEAAVGGTLALDEKAKLGFYQPDAFLPWLRAWVSEDTRTAKPERTTPRKQNVSFWSGALSEQERKEREGKMLGRLAEAMKRPER